ncbi:putative F420-dependent oxidoreductase [Rhodococcus sp. AG1013]|uniref:LLM class F420-dependent oxidoreductase n=1 Tax=Rhodococcus sp. AG1013 TaxID=2183996 RepID=UPI000E0A4939|nr:LLM class F420-dependent oxidoreductase [Rhodococcus sp. AG1013]RDI18031.1 putative F420-dependent oxidoreductase [Rhodococcus sp. AG1013]
MATATHPVRIGLHIQLQHADYDAIRRTVREAEELGVDIVFDYDHFYPLSGDLTGKTFECWTTLAGWAETTDRIAIGPLVTCNAYRNPDLLADMARTVDHISDGRLILGIGSGWAQKDFDEYGYAFGTAGSRLDDLAAALPRIEHRLAVLNPPPVRKIPLLIGGGGEKKTLPMVARHADIWHGIGDLDTLGRKNTLLDEYCAAAGRDPHEIERSAPVSPQLGTTPPQLLDLVFTLFTWTIGGPHYNLSPLRPWLDWRDRHNRA